MINFAIDGITSLSVKPIRLITGFGVIVSLLGFMVCIICFIGGIQLLSLGVIGEYVGKMYLETKKRPRYIIKDKKGSAFK